MKSKKILREHLLLTFIFLLCVPCFSQTVEKIGTNHSIKNKEYPAALGHFPSGLYVDEIQSQMICFDPRTEDFFYYDLTDFETSEPIIEARSCPYLPGLFKMGNDYWAVSSQGLVYIFNNSPYKFIDNVSSGISFILKKGSGYIVYYVDGKGIPGAVDTEGVIYTSEEAMGYLKEYDSEKYEESLLRAEELGLKEKFLNDEVLVWGETYYSTLNILENFYVKYPFISSDLIQYDQNGYGYQMIFDYDKTKLCIINPDGRNLSRSQYEGYADFLKNDYSGISTSWYVGFGGNIYYYIAGEDYTEVFRIRRTWGEPDFYAMAINGWTDDDYGTYVTEVLEGLSKADLRLLRNTVFALYGYHFNSADLAAHFDKEVWYTDDGKSAADITLPEHRAKLVEMIQALEAVARQ